MSLLTTRDVASGAAREFHLPLAHSAKERLTGMPMQHVLKNLDLWLACVGFSFVAVVTFSLMLARYVYSISLPGLEEINMIVFVWFLYFAMVYCLRKSAHIRVDVLDKILGKATQKLLEIIANVLVLAFAAIMLYFSVRLVNFNISGGGGATPVMNIPYFAIYMVLPVSFGLFAVSMIVQITRSIREFPSLLSSKKAA